MLADNLRKSILQAAIQGKLTEQLPTDGNAQDLLKNIRAERQKLIDAGKIKAAPPLPPIFDDEIPFDIPENWQWVRLGDICNYGEFESINPQNMIIGKFLLDLEDIEKNSSKLINKKFFDGNNAKSSKSIFYKGNVLYGKLRPYLNKVLIADEDGYCTSEILPLNFGKNIFNGYAKYFLISPFFSSYATNLSCGTKMPRLRTEDGKKALFPLPPLAEQERIVAKVEELLAELQPLEESEKSLDQLEKDFPQKIKASLLQAAIQGKLSEQLPTDGDAKDLLVKIRAERQKLIDAGKIKAATPLPPISPDEIPFDIPENWQWVRLGDICEIVGGGTPEKSNPQYWNGHINWATVSDMKTDFINETIFKITDEGLENSSTNIIKKGALIIATRVGLGKVCYNNIDTAINQDLKGIYLFKNTNRKYIFHYFKAISNYIIKNGTGTTVKGVKLEFIKNLLVPLPPLAEQERIVARLEELLAEIEI